MGDNNAGQECRTEEEATMAPDQSLVVFDGPKIDGRRVRCKRDKGRIAQMSGFLSGQIEGPPDKAARDFLITNSRLFADKPEALDELEVKQVSQSPAGYHVVLQQVHQGVMVEGGQVAVHMTRDKRVHSATNNLMPEATQLDVQAMARDGIDEDEARQLAREYVRSDGGVVQEERAEQVILPGDRPRLAWKVWLSARQPAREWMLWIDVSTGEVVRARELSVQ